VQRPRGLKYASEQAGATEASTGITSWLPARRAYSSERVVLELISRIHCRLHAMSQGLAFFGKETPTARSCCGAFYQGPKELQKNGHPVYPATGNQYNQGQVSYDVWAQENLSKGKQERNIIISNFPARRFFSGAQGSLSSWHGFSPLGSLQEEASCLEASRH